MVTYFKLSSTVDSESQSSFRSFDFLRRKNLQTILELHKSAVFRIQPLSLWPPMRYVSHPNPNLGYCDPWKPLQFVPGFFAQDVVEPGSPLPDVCIPAAEYVWWLYHHLQIFPRFGLIDSSDDRWPKFEAKIRQLNQDSPIGTTYKFFILSRHGQGYRTDFLKILK